MPTTLLLIVISLGSWGLHCCRMDSFHLTSKVHMTITLNSNNVSIIPAPFCTRAPASQNLQLLVPVPKTYQQRHLQLFLLYWLREQQSLAWNRRHHRTKSQTIGHVLSQVKKKQILHTTVYWHWKQCVLRQNLHCHEYP